MTTVRNAVIEKLVRRTDFSKRFHRGQIALRLNRRERSVSPRVRMIRVRAMRDQVIEQAKASEKRGESKCGFARVIGCVNVAVRLQERPCYGELAFVNDAHQSRIAIMVGRARIRASGDQLVERIGMIVIGGKDQRRVAARIDAFYWVPRLEQRIENVPSPFSCSVEPFLVVLMRVDVLVRFQMRDSHDFRCASCQQHSTCSHASDRTPCKAKVSTLLHTRCFREARHAG